MDKAMAREEMALVLSRACVKLGAYYRTKPVSGTEIPDFDKVGSYYKDAVRWVYGAGIIQGMNDAGDFAPAEALNRAQVATILATLLNAKGE